MNRSDGGVGIYKGAATLMRDNVNSATGIGRLTAEVPAPTADTLNRNGPQMPYSAGPETSPPIKYNSLTAIPTQCDPLSYYPSI
jgi:hypothetical protein